MTRLFRWVVALVTASTLLLIAPATAHDTLVESQPAADEVLPAPPTEIALRFSGELLEISPAILVKDASGATVAEGTPTVDGVWARLPLEELPAGEYDVAWSVVSSDGHRIQGDYAFSVRGGGGADGTEESPAGAADAGESAEDGNANTQDDQETVTDQDATASVEQQNDGASSAWRNGLLAVAGLGALATIIALLVRRRNGTGPF